MFILPYMKLIPSTTIHFPWCRPFLCMALANGKPCIKFWKIRSCRAYPLMSLSSFKDSMMPKFLKKWYRSLSLNCNGNITCYSIMLPRPLLILWILTVVAYPLCISTFALSQFFYSISVQLNRKVYKESTPCGLVSNPGHAVLLHSLVCRHLLWARSF